MPDTISWIDSHTHIYLEQFDDDLDEVITRAVQANVDLMFMPNIDSSTLSRLKGVAERFPDICRPMMGLHPCSVKQNYEAELQLVYQELSLGGYYAVGETGTDMYWDKTLLQEQTVAFLRQVDYAKEFKLPVVIHSRETLDINIQLIEEHQDGELKGVFHCFTGDDEQAKRIVDTGFYLGIGGVATFKNTNLREILPGIPLQCIVLETDAPYLAPAPHRGKRNEPAYIPDIARTVAEVYGLSMEELSALTTKNAKALFGVD